MGSGEIAGVSGLTPQEAAAVMAMVFVKRESFCTVRGFTAGTDGWAKVTPSGGEWGNSPIEELESYKGPLGIGIERDLF